MVDNILIFGAGSSGLGAAFLAKKLGCSVSVFDEKPAQDRFMLELKKLGLEITIGDWEKALEKNNQELAFEPTDFGFIENGKSNNENQG